MDQDLGFLNDTSLIKTPKSPLKTSTALRPNLRRGVLSKQNALNGMDISYDNLEGSSFPTLNEVTNLPNNTALKIKFNESSFADDRNSSLGILQMENVSDFTDTSLYNTSLNPKRKVKSKKTSKSKSKNLKGVTSVLPKKTYRLSETVLSTQETDVNHNEESSDSSDIEYDGTNIPELNLDYDPLSLHKGHESVVSKKVFSEELDTKDKVRTKSSLAAKTACSLSNMSAQSSNDELQSLLATNKTGPRDSIFENFDPAYDSIFKTLKPNGGVQSIDMSEIKGAALLNFKSLEIESILRNESSAEMNFMKNLDMASNSSWNSSVKFCPDEISSRSSSFRSSGASKSASQTFASSSIAQTESKNISNAEDLGDEVQKSSFFGSSLGKSESFNFTSSLTNKTSTSVPSECIPKENTFLKSELDVSSTTDVDFVSQKVEEFEYPCNLNFKDTSVFATEDAFEQNRFEVSENDFISPDEAIAIFKKDEEALNEERRFEIGNDTKGSIFSNASSPSHNNISAPSWFLENNENPDQRISIGTLISARTECLGRLSQDSKRERPFFGIPVRTPIRETAESSSYSIDSNFRSASVDSTSVISSEGAFPTFCETPKSHFESNVFDIRESAPRDVLQDYSPISESGVIRGSALSQLLNEMSTDQPLKLASKILHSCNPLAKHLTTNQSDHGTSSTPFPTGSKKNVGTSTNTIIEADKLDSTLTRSSSEDSLGDTLTETPVNRGDYCAESSNENSHKPSSVYSCSNCNSSQQKASYTCSRPQSSCSSVCSNSMPIQNGLQAQYGCMKFFASSQEHCQQNPFSSCGSIARSDAGLLRCHNPFAQDMLRMQMVGPQQGFQQMIPADCVQCPYPMQGAVYSYPSLQGPNELIYPEKLSIGDSQSISLTIQNIHNLLFYHVSFVSAFVNEEPVSLEIAGVSFPCVVPRSSNSTTDIQVNLSPKYEGNIVVTLQVIASFNPANVTLSSLSSLSLQTKIKYESLRPCIAISSRGQSSLNLGKVIGGSTVLEHITISNRCDATVPLYISLSNDSEDNRITFGLNQMKSHKYPATSGWKMLSPKIMRYRLPCSKDESIESHLDIPIVIEAGNQDAVVNFTLTAAVESFSVRETLGLFRISVNVGIAELVLADPRQKHLLLFAKNGSSTSRSLTLKHKGSFPVIYDLMVVDDTQSFSVSPSSLNLQPMQSSSISISFLPKSNEVVEGVLQAAAQPHGKIFSLTEIVGEVKEAARNSGPSKTSIVPNVHQEKRSKETKGSSLNNIECNRKYLCWGGIDVGNTVIKTFSIRNSTNKSLKGKLFIKEKSNRFKLLNESKEQSTILTVNLNAKEERTVLVSYSPTKVEPSSGFLVIKPDQEKETKIFSMPLSGYGGIGKLKVTQISEKEGIGSCLDIVLPTERRPVFNSIAVHNIGLRPIFVKALFTPAVSAGNLTSDVQVSINPSEFVLCEKENKTLYISYTSSRIYEEGGVITLLHGDEILRQLLRRSRNELSSSSQNDLIRSVNFDIHYVGEERLSYDPLYQCISKVSSIFYQSVKKYLIHLNIVEENASYSHMTFDVLSILDNTYPEFTMNSTAYHSRRLTAATNIGHSPPVKDFTVDMLNRLSMPHQRSFMDMISQGDLSEVNDLNVTTEIGTEGWIIRPEVLNIDYSNKDNRILLVNNSTHDLRFKVESAIDVISISPVSGTIPAKGEIGLRITIIPYNYTKLCDDYKGFVKVICDSLEKNVLINVLKDQRKTNDPSESNLVLEGHQLSVLEEDSFTDRAENTIISQPSEFIKNICDFPKEITLTTTVPDKVSETLLTVHNPEKVSVQWDIRPISVLFAESLDDTLIPTQILQIKPTSGTLKSLEVSSIVIKFMPSRPDSYSRFFELTTTLEGGSEQKCNFKVHGKASFWLTENTSKHNEGVKKKSKDTIYIENESSEFPNTVLGQTSTVYVKVKNPSLQDVKLKIIKPHLPFVVRQSSVVVKSKKFIKIPVNFKPTKVSKVYEDILVLHSEDGYQFMFKMKAAAIEGKK